MRLQDGQHAWIIKHCDLQESLEEIGRRMLQCAIVSTADQVASARERIAQSASRAKVLEEKLLKVRLSLWHQRRDVKSMLNTMASDRVQREMRHGRNVVINEKTRLSQERGFLL
eukprot:g28279.t1